MSLAAFQGSVTLTSVVENGSPGSGNYTVSFVFRDNEGIYLGTDVLVGDTIVLDTSAIATGELSRYTITSITSQTFSTVTAVMQYDTGNDAPSPDLASYYDFSVVGLITRRTPNNSLLNLPSLQIQGLSDKFAFYLINFMNRAIVDTLVTTSAAAAASVATVHRKASVTNNSRTATVNIVASGSQANIDAITVSQTNGNTIVLSNVPPSLFLQSITVHTPAGFNPTTSFQIQYPEPFGDTSALDMMAPFMMSYNEPGVIQSTTLLNYSISAGIVQAQKTGLVANAAQTWRLQVM